VGSGLVARDLALAYEATHARAGFALDVPSFRVSAGERVGITGASGSGKTSLLYVLAGLERPERGAVLWDGTDILALPEPERDRWRRRTVGFVFQDFHLFSGLSALDNALLPATFERALIPGSVRQRARALLREVCVRDEHLPVERLSRGEMQRVALARALLFEPAVILADEPTASLDAEAARLVSDLMISLARATSSTVLIATHDGGLLSRLDRSERLVDGRVHRSPAMAAAS